jgi:hypothetical protein
MFPVGYEFLRSEGHPFVGMSEKSKARPPGMKTFIDTDSDSPSFALYSGNLKVLFHLAFTQL